MRILDAQFLKSATSRSEWPPAEGRPEVALCGRSNVGKSSLLNTLLGRRGLARVSRTPGRTRLLNFFTVDYLRSSQSAGGRSQLLLADLPGFGYAEVGRNERQQWRKMMEEYLAGRETLRAVVLLFDGRRVLDPRASELLYDETELAHYLSDHGRVVIPVITKADKLSKSERKPAAAALGRLIGKTATIYSSLSGEGQQELGRRIVSALRPQQPAAAAAKEPMNEDEHESDSL